MNQETNLTPETQDSIRQWCNDVLWEERRDVLAVGVVNRMKHVDKAILAGSHIARMLAEDRWGAVDAEDHPGVRHVGLSAVDREMLQLALLELLDLAEDHIEEIRENRGGFVSLPLAVRDPET